jgi:hypothetical protein
MCVYVGGEREREEERASVFFYFFFVRLLALRPLLPYCCQPRVIVKMIVEKQMECRLAGETEVLGQKTCPQRHFCPSQNPTHDQTWVWTRAAAAVGSRRLTVWAYGAAWESDLATALEYCHNFVLNVFSSGENCSGKRPQLSILYSLSTS